MPKGAEILCVQMQNNIPCIWAKVETENDNELRFIEVFGTGHRIDGNTERKYIGTFQNPVGNIVFHVFELLKNK